MKIYTNHSGTMKDDFRIGKNGVKVINGDDLPPIDITDIKKGSLFMSKQGKVYILSDYYEWEEIRTKKDNTFFYMLLAKTIKECVTIFTVGMIFTFLCGIIIILSIK